MRSASYRKLRLCAYRENVARLPKFRPSYCPKYLHTGIGLTRGAADARDDSVGSVCIETAKELRTETQIVTVVPLQDVNAPGVWRGVSHQMSLTTISPGGKHAPLRQNVQANLSLASVTCVRPTMPS